MPRVYPSNVDSEYFHDEHGKVNHGEWSVYKRLREVLPASWILIPRQPWLRKNNAQRVRYESRGECDFIIIDPTRGILILEVKTGVTWDPTTGWRNLGGCFDPRVQLERNKKWLEGHAKETLNRQLEVGYVWCLPDYDYAVDPAFGEYRLMDQRTLFSDRLVQCLGNAFESWGLQESLSTAQIERLAESLLPKLGQRREWRLEQYQVESKIREATEKQYKVLNCILRRPRVAVSGCAGSGKTMLALESARQLASQGQRVLLVCFNEQLLTSLCLTQKVETELQSVDIFSFYGYGRELLNRANRTLRSQHAELLQLPKNYFDSEDDLISLLAAGEQVPGEYDAVVIDEGQDFNPDWVDVLVGRLREPTSGRMVMFFDEFQKLYERGSPSQVVQKHQMHLETLNINCRNPLPVHESVMRYHPEGDRFTPLVESGPSPKRLEFMRNVPLKRTQTEKLAAWLHEVKPKGNEVAILVPHDKERLNQSWSAGARVGQYVITQDVSEWLAPTNKKFILASTVHRFKGLESSFIVMSDLEGIPERRRAERLYTGLSRARFQLVYMWPTGLKL